MGFPCHSRNAHRLPIGSPLAVHSSWIHSQCFTGEVMGPIRCDCGSLEFAIRMIAEEGSGVLIYENQVGRGIGLMAKLKVYELQDAGLETIEANHALGYEADSRNFGLPVAILGGLDIKCVRLLTNNPQKFRTLVNAGIEVVEQIPCHTISDPHAFLYLRRKKEKIGQTLTLFSKGCNLLLVWCESIGGKSMRIPHRNRI
jgi:GTP cyclohydrolase II